MASSVSCACHFLGVMQPRGWSMQVMPLWCRRRWCPMPLGMQRFGFTKVPAAVRYLQVADQGPS